MSNHALPADCPNCTSPVTGPFCAACGQETVIETPTVVEFLHETLHHYVAAEGKIWRTLFLLVLRPGKLTAEYMAGRRKRYIRPVQLYLTLSFVFFLAAGLTGQLQVSIPENAKVIADVRVEPFALPPEAQAELNADPDARESTAKVKRGLDYAKGRWDARVAKAGGDPSAALRTVVDETMHRIPLALFFLMPLLALGLNVVYFSRAIPYGGHLLLSIHLHAFVFALLTLALIPLPFDLNGSLVVFAPAIYFLLAIKRFYGGRWWPQILRAGVVLGFYGVCLSIGLSLVVGASFFL